MIIGLLQEILLWLFMKKKNFNDSVLFLCTVLSDTNKRFLYDVGAYDSDDDENVCFFFFSWIFQKILFFFPFSL